MMLKYIGPFLRINKLKKETIRSQLFYLSKESLKHIVLYSGCGIKTSVKELKIKNIPSSDINIFSSVSPLLCIYKKASPKLETMGYSSGWNIDKFKKEINIDSNALMTLSLLELSSYYDRFKDTDLKKFFIGETYKVLCKKQLEFYASYFRNEEGVFVDKIDASDFESDNFIFNEKNKKFKYSSQALIMAAFYKCSCTLENKERESYKNFSLEILKMLLQYREELYKVSFDELSKLCLGLNIFYKYSKNEDCKILLLDICELLNEQSLNDTNYCMTYINSMLFYKSSGIILFKEICDSIFSKLIELYDSEKGIFIWDNENKEIEYESSDIVLYLLCLLMGDCTNDILTMDIFKRQLVDSGIILSWPEAPDISDMERYRNFSLKTEDLLDDQDFRMPSVPSPDSSEFAPVFTKNITYNRKKEIFIQPKPSFDSYKNMLIFFLILIICNSEDIGSV